ncbi:MAG: histidine kinase [Nitrospirae bacterium]|nr:histidine kinase [Nitrospirota bacterium]
MHKYVFTIDHELKISSWDKGLETLTGKDFSSVKGVPYYEVFPRICNGANDAALEALTNGKPQILKGNRNICLYGTNETDINIQPLKDDSEKLIGATITIEPCVSCQIWEKFQQSQPLIDIGKIASTLAHGVRSPLNAIKGAVIYIKERYAEEQTLIEFSKIMEDEISRLDTFVSKFLSASVFDADLSETDVNKVLKKIEIFTSFQAKSFGIKTTYEYGDIPPVRLSPFQLEQAVLNVINNAIDAMGSNGHLKVRTYKETGSGADFVVIEISDTGPGMSKGRLKDISIPVDGKGRGYGLFITREVIKSQGGHVEIQSEKGAGTKVRLYLTLRKIEN